MGRGRRRYLTDSKKNRILKYGNQIIHMDCRNGSVYVGWKKKGMTRPASGEIMLLLKDMVLN